MKLNRKWLLVIALLLSVVAATAGTLAYLTDRDSEANVFTMGNVEIDLKEDFEQGAELIPGIDIEKKPVITNTGKTEAWAWMIVSVPTALDNWNQGGGQEGSNNNVIHWNITGATHEGYVNQDRVDKAIEDGILPKGTTAADILANNQTWDVLNNGLEYQNAIDGVMYNHYVMLYNKALEPGETTLPIMYKVFLDAHVDIDPEGNMSKVDAGVVTPIDWNVNEDKDGNPIIYVSAYAIQKEGFATVEEAYAAYTKQWTTAEGNNNGLEYGEDDGVTDTPIIPNGIYSLQDLKDAAKNGGEYVLAADIHITDKNEFFYGSYVTAVYKDMTLDLNGHDIIVDVEMETVAKAPVLFYVYSEGAALTVVGDGDVIAKHDAFIFFPRSVSEGLYIYGGNYYNVDDTSGTKNDINAIVYSQINDNIHVYGGTFTFKNVSGHCGGFNVYDNSGAEIVLHEGVLLSNSNYYQGSDGNEIHLAEGCALQEVVIDGATWYKVVKE